MFREGYLIPAWVEQLVRVNDRSEKGPGFEFCWLLFPAAVLWSQTAAPQGPVGPERDSQGCWPLDTHGHQKKKKKDTLFRGLLVLQFSLLLENLAHGTQQSIVATNGLSSLLFSL